MTTSYFWLIAMVVLLVIEAIIPGLVSIWFAIGALVAAVASALNAPQWLQGGLFVVVSVAALILTRPLARRFIKTRAQPTNADALIGRDCVVTERIDTIEGTGAVKVGGKIWSAAGIDGRMVFEPGCLARILEIRGVKLIVEPIENQL